MDVFLRTRRDSELEERDIDKAKNVGFRVYDKGVVTFERYVLGDGIYTRPLDFSANHQRCFSYKVVWGSIA